MASSSATSARASSHASTSSQRIEDDNSSEIESSEEVSQSEQDSDDDSDVQSESSTTKRGKDQGESRVKKIVPKSSEKKRKRVGEGEGDSGSERQTVELADTQVLSHAEKRHLKKKEQKAEVLKKSKKSAKAEVSTSKRQNSVWVGNLSYKTTVEDLKSFFSGAGEITRVNMPLKASSMPGRKSENRGFAYVDFAAPDGKASAIALTEEPLIGRKLLIKDGDDFAGRPKSTNNSETPTTRTGNEEGQGGDVASTAKTHSKTAQKILRAQKQPPGPTLFLGNLGFETTEADILEMLTAHHTPSGTGRKSASKHSRAGPNGNEASDTPKQSSWIRKVRMGTFEDSGLCKGYVPHPFGLVAWAHLLILDSPNFLWKSGSFAFVDFMTTDDATLTLINPRNHLLNGRKLVVEYASPDAVRRGAPKGKAHHEMTERAAKESPQRGPRRTWTDPARQVSRAEAVLDEGEFSVENAGAGERPSKRQRMDKAAEGGQGRPEKEAKARAQDGERRRGPKYRTTPGAALASAKRESAAIMPSQGKKIMFD
ncbi:hypothetical protein AX17_002099 [Amanita inopinata Kibby_2008]|nr:hypothetical protein AX17_002099 [Amanita inopinata Kibby_2008]